MQVHDHQVVVGLHGGGAGAGPQRDRAVEAARRRDGGDAQEGVVAEKMELENQSELNKITLSLIF